MHVGHPEGYTATDIVSRYVELDLPFAPLIDMLTFATVREDLDFHSLQVLEAGVKVPAFTQITSPTPTRRAMTGRGDATGRARRVAGDLLVAVGRLESGPYLLVGSTSH